MWDVEKKVKTYRKAGERYIFDGSAETVYVSVTLITSDGPFKSFSIPLGEDLGWLSDFTAALRNNVKIVTTEYNEITYKKRAKEKQIADGWDGIYN
jgi:hypothetical protein